MLLSVMVMTMMVPVMYGQGWDLRLGLECAATGGDCTRSGRCCNDKDRCLTIVTYNSRGSEFPVNTCINVHDFFHNVVGGKRAGQQCEDSRECVDQCCRRHLTFHGMLHMCGAPDDEVLIHTCAVVNTKSAQHSSTPTEAPNQLIPKPEQSQCAKTEAACSVSKPCCHQEDICLSEKSYNNKGHTVWTNKCRTVSEAFRGASLELMRGEPCEDSRDCADLCCRKDLGQICHALQQGDKLFECVVKPASNSTQHTECTSSHSDACSNRKRCCNKSDVCLTERYPTEDGAGARTTKTTCRHIKRAGDDHRSLENGKPCTDSRDCAASCCREYLSIQREATYRCGNPVDEDGVQHTCVIPPGLTMRALFHTKK